MTKALLYKQYLSRMDSAFKYGFNLETIWCAYAILEDRLLSMLKNTGGVPMKNNGNGGSFLMAGAKLSELEIRAKSDGVLRVNLETQRIRLWLAQRNKLMHGMMNGSMTLVDIEGLADSTAKDGIVLSRDVCAAAMRVKKHGKIVQRSR